MDRRLWFLLGFSLFFGICICIIAHKMELHWKLQLSEASGRLLSICASLLLGVALLCAAYLDVTSPKGQACKSPKISGWFELGRICAPLRAQA